MVLKCYTIYDSKVEAYLQPFYMQNRGAAIRGFSDTVNDSSKPSNLTNHPEDFTLFEIGEWDDQDGTLKMYGTKISLGVAIEFKKGLPDNGVSKLHSNSKGA